MDLSQAIDQYINNLPEVDVVAQTWDKQDIYQGDSVWEFDNEFCFDDLEDIEEFLNHIGATRRVME